MTREKGRDGNEMMIDAKVTWRRGCCVMHGQHDDAICVLGGRGVGVVMVLVCVAAVVVEKEWW